MSHSRKQLAMAGLHIVCATMIRANRKIWPPRNISASLGLGWICNRTFCDDMNVLHLCCPILNSVFTSSYWPLEMWLVRLRNWIFNFNMVLMCHICWVATVLDSRDYRNNKTKKLMIPGHMRNILSVEGSATSFFISIRHMHNYIQGKYRNPHCISHITKGNDPSEFYTTQGTWLVFMDHLTLQAWIEYAWDEMTNFSILKGPFTFSRGSEGRTSSATLWHWVSTLVSQWLGGRCRLVASWGKCGADRFPDSGKPQVGCRHVKCISWEHSPGMQHSTFPESVSVKPVLSWAWCSSMSSSLFPLNVSGHGATWWRLFSPVLAK